MPAGLAAAAHASAALSACGRAALAALAVPFDVVRALHAAAVHRGFARRSVLLARDLEIGLALLEVLSLGPFARRR